MKSDSMQNIGNESSNDDLSQYSSNKDKSML